MLPTPSSGVETPTEPPQRQYLLYNPGSYSLLLQGQAIIFLRKLQAQVAYQGQDALRFRLARRIDDEKSRSLVCQREILI